MHASALIGFVVPLGNVVAPLVLWLLARRRGTFVDEHGREAVNFNLSIVLYALIAGVLILLPIGLVAVIAVAGLLLVAPIVAATQGGRGREFHYPASIRFIPWSARVALPPPGGRQAA